MKECQGVDVMAHRVSDGAWFGNINPALWKPSTFQPAHRRLFYVCTRSINQERVMGFNETSAFAASICGIKPIPRVINAPVKLPNMAVDPSKLRGLHEHQYESENGTYLDCYLEYEKAYDGGSPSDPNSEESYPESISLVYALVNGVDIAEFLEDTNTKKLIEDEALATIQTDAFDERDDRADHAFEMRRAA